MDQYKAFWTNYFNFSGRASRSDYWIPVLFNSLVYVVLTTLSFIVMHSQVLFMVFAIILGIYAVAAFIPSVSIAFRRFHDTGRSGKILVVYYILSLASGIFTDSRHWVGVLMSILMLAMAIYVLVVTVLPTKHVDERNYKLL